MSSQFGSEMCPESDRSPQFPSPPSPKPISHVETISFDRLSCSPCRSCPTAVCTSRNHQRFFPKLKSAHITALFKPFNGFPLFLESNSDSAMASEVLQNPRIQPLPAPFFSLPLSHCALATLALFLPNTSSPFFHVGCFLCLKRCSPGSLHA